MISIMEFNDQKYAQRERLIFLDNCLTWRGMANRRDLVDRFRISNGQAALDFKLYLERANGTPPVYNKNKKTYLAAPNHQQLTNTRLTEAFDAVLGEPRNEYSASLPGLERHADSLVISHLYQAIQLGTALNIHYTSMRDRYRCCAAGSCRRSSRPTANECISEHTVSNMMTTMITFLFVSVLTALLSKNRWNAPIPVDEEWNTLARIYLKPKSDLSFEQAQAVRREYRFVDDLLCIETRKALEFYADRRWGLDQPHARLERERVDYFDISERVIRDQD